MTKLIGNFNAPEQSEISGSFVRSRPLSGRERFFLGHGHVGAQTPLGRSFAVDPPSGKDKIERSCSADRLGESISRASARNNGQSCLW